MMKKIFYTIMLAAVVFAGCKKEVKSEGIGTLEMKVSTSSADYVTKSTNSDIREFVISIKRTADGWTRTYPRFADMPQMLDLGSGSYTVTATSLYREDAAWDQPIYSGSADFSIVAGELTPVSLVCTLSNMKVTIVPSDNFNEEVSSYTVTVTNASSWEAADVADKTLSWVKSNERDDIAEGKAGYFTVAPLLVKVDGYRSIDPDGNNECHAELVISNVAPRDHHEIKLDARVTGQAGFQITIDDSLTEKQDDVFVPGWDETPVEGGGEGGEGGDDPINPDDPPVVSTAPVFTWSANPNFEETLIAEEMSVEILIEAQKKIAKFEVEVNSRPLGPTLAALAERDNPNYFADHPFVMDMIYDTVLCDALDGMGLGIPVKDAVLGQTRVLFSLSRLIPMISVYLAPDGSDAGSRHIFTLSVTDEEDQVTTQPIIFVAPSN